jgi:hypothetical protein
MCRFVIERWRRRHYAGTIYEFSLADHHLGPATTQLSIRSAIAAILAATTIWALLGPPAARQARRNQGESLSLF